MTLKNRLQKSICKKYRKECVPALYLSHRHLQNMSFKSSCMSHLFQSNTARIQSVTYHFSLQRDLSCEMEFLWIHPHSSCVSLLSSNSISRISFYFLAQWTHLRYTMTSHLHCQRQWRYAKKVKVIAEKHWAPNNNCNFWLLIILVNWYYNSLM